MSIDDHDLRNLHRLKWRVLGLTSFVLVALEAYYYFVRGVPLLDDLIDWLLGMSIALVLIEIAFQAVAKLQRRLQHEIVERRQTEEELQQHMAQLEALRGVTLQIDAHLSLDDLLRDIVGRAVDLLGGTSGGIYLYRPERDALEWTTSVGPGMAPIGTLLRRGEGLSGRIWDRNEPLVVDDYRHWEGGAAVYDGCPWTAVAGVPVRWAGEFLGVLDVLTDAPRTFSSADVELLSLFATHAASAIHRARLFKAEQVAREEAEEHTAELGVREHYLSLLNDITRTALETPDLQTMLQTLADRMGELIDADGCHLILWDEARQVAIPGAVHGPVRDIHASMRVEPGEATMTAEVLRSGQPLAVEDVFDTPYPSPRLAAMSPARSQLALPLIAGDEKLGAAIIAFNEPHRFGPDEIARCEQAAGQIALAVAKIRLVHELREALAQVKTLRGLLPICANCKKVRDDQGYWHSVEVYVRDHSEAEFSHAICPECMKKLYPWFKGGKE
jgi:GAF domain-containing protein